MSVPALAFLCRLKKVKKFMEQTPDHETDLSLRQVSDRHGIELHFLFTKNLKIDRGKFEGCEGRLGLFKRIASKISYV